MLIIPVCLMLTRRFRPLAGINCNKTRLMMAPGKGRFRPLAGINCKYTFIKTSYPIKLVPSPYGI